MSFRNEYEKELLSSAARTSSGTGDTVTGLDNYHDAVLHLIITAASGTSPTLDVVVQECIYGSEGVSTNWVDAVTFTQASAAGSERKELARFGGKLRVKYTISAGASFTFKVVGAFKD